VEVNYGWIVFVTTAEALLLRFLRWSSLLLLLVFAIVASMETDKRLRRKMRE
jgi:hypothetical protein